jgi:hypothetical protein
VSRTAVERIRVFSEDCQLDAVTARALALNVRLPTASRPESFVAVQGDVRNRAPTAHSTRSRCTASAADASLDRLVAQNQPEV